MKIESIELILKIIKILLRNYFIIYMSNKLINEEIKSKKNFKEVLGYVLSDIITTVAYIYIDSNYGIFYGTTVLILITTIIICNNRNTNIVYSLLINVISVSINYVLLLIAVLVSGIIDAVFKFNFVFNNIIILLMYMLMAKKFINMRKFKKGFDFIQGDIKNGYFDAIILNIGAWIIFLITFAYNSESKYTIRILLSIFVLAVIMFITIFKSFQLYYKHRNLIKALKLTEDEKDKYKKENEELEKENLTLHQENHNLAHKQRVLNYKIDKILEKITNSGDICEIKKEYENISKELYKEKVRSPITKTGIQNIDDIIEYMQSECVKNKITFDVQIIGNIFGMINNCITKEELEILIADHVKDAIIAVNHSKNQYKSILIRIGKIENTYSLYIFDSGIEFEEETLKQIGQTPCTTHADEGGTGMGFMNTFKTLEKHKASLTIKEIGKPNESNYTKVIMIKFDNKNEFKIDSYKKNNKN